MIRIPRSRAGFTLFEVMIAMSIFAVAVGALINSLTGLRATVAVGSAQDSLTSDADTIITTMRDDLITSGWYFPDSSVVTAGVSPAADRALRYYPYVQMQGATTASLGTAFPQHTRAAGAVGPSIPSFANEILEKTKAGLRTDQTTAFGLGATQRSTYLASYFARSQELIFLRSTNSAWNDRADKVSLEQRPSALIRFRNDKPRAIWRADGNWDTLEILHASGWSVDTDAGGNISGYPANKVQPWPGGSLDTANTKPYGVVMESGLLVDPTGDLSQISPNWETLDGSGYYVPNLTNLKEMSYCVIPSRYGFGRLVRARRVTNADAQPQFNPATNVWGEPGVCISRNGTDGMVVDKVLSDDVVRVVFDTYRTVDRGNTSVTSLDINQIKVRVYMVRPSAQDRRIIIRRMFETVISMRSMNSAYDKDFSQGDSRSTSSRLGQAPVGISY